MIRYRSVCVASASLALALVACQGESGTGGGLSIPAPQYTNPPGPGGFAASTSREQTLDGAVTLSAGRTELPLPSLDGFSVSLELGTPPPSSAPAAASSASPGAAKTAALDGTAARPVPTTSPVADPSPAANPSPLASGAAAVAQAASTSAAPSAGPSAAAAGGEIATKTTVYPEDAPVAPSPKPTGDVQTFVKRTALVRGYLQPVADITLYGLGALRFTIPQSEQTPGRGFTVAVYVAGKKHHEELVAADTAPTLLDDVVQSSQTSSPLVLKKASGYLVLLYADQAPPTPAPAGVYPTPGTNPFPTQTPSGQGGFPQQQPGYPQPPGYTPQPGYPQQTPTPTPFP